MAAEAPLFSMENPVFRAYLFYSAILTLKTLAMALLTAKQRFTHKIFANPEDTKGMKTAKVKYDHVDVERVRRAHHNDLENIPVFLAVSLAYVATSPCPTLALNLFRLFTAVRFLHTFVYAVVVVRQPARALAFIVGVIITVYMAVNVIIAAW